ncbi:MAG: rubrerythrin family protein [Thermoplasmata archaeon]
MSETDENLRAAFAGESQANRRYLAFAHQAQKEGFPEIAKLFRIAAESETFHALNHLKTMGGIGTTEENLVEAMDGERQEAVNMYPEFIKQANSEENKKAARTFSWALAAEKVHEGLYSEALEGLKTGKDLEKKDLYLCPVCGYTMEGEAPDRCPICNAPRDQFTKF